ncbi:MAG: MBG domain-containing protein [Christensenellaceae bacterium]|jgi:hypothetical protein|nr:MBG domain-containing protein [Christensenellaceae bacterium]
MNKRGKLISGIFIAIIVMVVSIVIGTISVLDAGAKTEDIYASLYNAAPTDGTVIKNTNFWYTNDNTVNGTYLDDSANSGMQVGSNTLQTRGTATGGNVSGSSNPVAGTFRDFRMSGITYYAATATAFEGTASSDGAVLASNIRFNTTDKQSYGLASAIKDSGFQVKFNFDAMLDNRAGTTTTFVVYLNWYPTGPAGSRVANTSKNVTIDSGASNLTGSGYELTVPTATDIDLAKAVLEIVIYIPSNVNFRILSPAAGAEVMLSSTVNIATTSSLVISGENRNTYTIQSTQQLNTGGYVKPGDTVEFTTYAYTSSLSNRYVFSDVYPYVMGLQNLSGTEKFIGKQNGMTYDDTNPACIVYESNGIELTKVTEEYQKVTNNQGEFVSYKTSFIVGQNLSMGTVLNIRPKIIIGVNFDGSFVQKYQKETGPYTISIDSVIPSMPEIAPNSTLGKAISQEAWYTATNSPTLEMSSTSHTIATDEHTFAFVFPSYVLSIDASLYDFSSYITQFEIDEGAVSIPVTTNLDGSSIPGNVQRLFKYTSDRGSSMPAKTKSLNFTDAGVFTVFLVSVDLAGNKSTVRTYVNVMVDASEHTVLASYRVGDGTITLGKGDIRFRYIIGENEHNADGSLKLTASTYLSQAKYLTTSGAKRGEYVTIMLVMNATAYSYYRLESYMNYASSQPAVQRPTMLLEGVDRYIYMRFIMDETNVEYGGIALECALLERAQIIIAQREFVYSGSPLNLSTYTQVSSITTTGSTGSILAGISTSFKYYNIYTVTASISGNVTTITYDGSNYTVNSLSPIVPLSTYTMGGKSYYSATVSQGTGGVYNLRIVPLDESMLTITNAGEYWFISEIATQIGTPRYYAVNENTVIINKASPAVLGLTATPITYGSSIDKLDYISYSTSGVAYSAANGNINIFYDLQTPTLEVKRLYLTSSGVWGEYIIKTPTADSQDYIMPEAGTININVEFSPFDPRLKLDGTPLLPDEVATYTSNYTFYLNFYNGITFTGGNGFYAANYSITTYTFACVINPAPATIEIDEESVANLVYNGNSLVPAYNTVPADLSYIALYELRNPNGSYGQQSAALPVVAGEYRASYYVQEKNYHSSTIISTFEVKKKSVSLSVEDQYLTACEEQGYTMAVTDDGKTYNRYFSSIYGRLVSPPMTVTSDNPDLQLAGIGYKYAFKLVRDLDGNPISSTYSEEMSLADVRTEMRAAGAFLLRIVVDATNFTGEFTLMVCVSPADALDATVASYFTISFPALKSSYAVYNIDSTTPMVNQYDTTIGHIEYGQTIAELLENNQIFQNMQIALIQFTYTSGLATVEGRFRLYSEEEITDSYEVRIDGKYILPVLYNSSNQIIPYYTYIVWEAGHYEGEVFIPNTGFKPITREISLYVARATPTFDKVFFDPIVYETTLDDLTWFGAPHVAGNNADITGIVGYDLISTQYQLVPSNVGYAPEVGVTPVTYRFVPSDRKNYRDVEFTVNITVTQKTAGITIEENPTAQYGDIYVAPIVTTNPASRVIQYEYFDGETPITINSATPVGVYRLVVTIVDKNYVGTAETNYTITKAQLEWNVQPTPQQGELRFGIKVDEIILTTSGSLKTRYGTYILPGTFKCLMAQGIESGDYIPTGTHVVTVSFTPASIVTAGFYDKYIVSELTINIGILKNVPDVAVTGTTVTYDGTQKSPVISFGNLIDDYSINYSVVYNDLSTGAELEGPPINAGSYNVTVLIDDPNYEKVSDPVVFKINKAPVDVKLGTYVFGYDGASHALTVELSVKDLAYSIAYVNNGGVSSSSPQSAAGKYRAVLELNESNYAINGVGNYPFYIIPLVNYVDLGSLVQSYGDVYGIDAGFNYDNVTSVTYYKQESTGIELTNVNKAIVDKYLLSFKIQVNGLICDVIASIGDQEDVYYCRTIINDNETDATFVLHTSVETIEDLYLTIEKAVVDINVLPLYTTVYDTKPYNTDSVYAIAEVDVKFVYSYYQIIDELQGEKLDQAINAGTYRFVIEIEDHNYAGTVDTVLVIQKADADARQAPSLDSRYSYSDDPKTVKFRPDGSVMFNGSNIANSGAWEITTQDFDKLGVGAYDNITFKFTPSDTSINSAYVIGTATVNKKDISEYVRYDDADLLQQYNLAQHKVRAYIDTAVADLFKASDKNLTLIVTYNGSTYQPERCGLYSIVITVSSTCYEGSIGSGADKIEMQIQTATPSIILPTIASIKLGQTLQSSSLSGGLAYIGDTSHAVEGEFFFENSAYKPDKLNYRTIYLGFAPKDYNNYNQVTFGASVLVLPVDDSEYNYSYGTVNAAEFIYGEPLSAVTITLTSQSLVRGSVEWVNPNYIAKNGESVQYRFIPASSQTNDQGMPYYDVYPIVYGNIQVVVNDATFVFDSESFATVYVGERLQELRLDIKIRNAKTGALVTDYNYTLDVGDTGVALNTLIEEAHATDSPNLDIRLHITKNSYTAGNFVLKDIKVRHYLSQDRFNAAVNSKMYDGVAIKDTSIIQMAEVNVANTTFEPMPGAYKITNIVCDGNTVDSVLAAGAYTISASYDDGTHYGTFSFTFVVDKRNISNAISPAVYTSTGTEEGVIFKTVEYIYGSNVDAFELEFSEFANGSVIEYDPDAILPYITYNYYNNISKDMPYGSTAPRNAGMYYVEVSISVECPEYVGMAAFMYRIDRKEANVYFPSAGGYTFQYGQIISIVPVIDVTETEGYYITYDGNRAVPENAGEYNVVAHLDGKNFYGTSSAVKLIIQKAKLVVAQFPTVSGLTYGQNLGSAKITGGIVMNPTTGTIANGAFAFMDPNIVAFTAGATNLVYLKYEYNDNYEMLENIPVNVSVGKATTSIDIINATAVYTGGEVYPQVRADTAYPVSFDMVFRRNAGVVAPISAGTYTVTVTINDDNYSGEITGIIFTITPAPVIANENPVASPVVYGSALSTSVLVGGWVRYFDTGLGRGSFTYLYPGLVPGEEQRIGAAGPHDVGTYEVYYIFTPDDTQNYLPYTGTVEIVVAKANIIIEVINNNFEYGQSVSTGPQFITTPGGIEVKNDEFETWKDYLESKHPQAGVYSFTATVNTDYYVGEKTYNILVSKKAIDFSFVNENGTKVDKYSTVYRVSLNASIAILVESVHEDDKLETLQTNVIYSYITTDGTNTMTFTPPSKVGEYIVNVSLSNNNYYIRPSESKIEYVIERAPVTSIEFDTDTISNQVYGSVAIPIINIQPVGVTYQLLFDNKPTLPTTVGDHNILVIVDDPNYVPTTKQNRFRILPKKITIEDIVVANKAFDGTSGLQISGSLKGVLQNDEVYLTMTARVKGGYSDVGSYDVEITSWELKGLHAGNYTIAESPVYATKVSITRLTVEDNTGSGYIMSNVGFNPNVTLVISDVYSASNSTSVFTAILGQRAVAKSVTVKENGNNKVLDEKVKFYVLIPESYRKSRNLTFQPVGGLEGEVISFLIEGDYVTFYADRSGEVLIIAHDFPYWLVIIGGALLFIVAAFVFIRVMPARRAYKTTSRLRQAHGMHAYQKVTSQSKQIKDKDRLDESMYNDYFD